MDMKFPRLDAAMATARPIAIGHRQLIAILAGAQAATPTAHSAMRISRDLREQGDAPDALVTLFSGGAGWAGAIASLGGSFDARVARRMAAKGL